MPPKDKVIQFPPCSHGRKPSLSDSSITPYALKKTSFKRVSRMESDTVTPVESALCEITKSARSFELPGSCWVVSGARLNEFQLLLGNSSLVNYFNQMVNCKRASGSQLSTCKEQDDSHYVGVCRLFQMLRQYLSLCNRWHSDNIIPLVVAKGTATACAEDDLQSVGGVAKDFVLGA